MHTDYLRKKKDKGLNLYVIIKNVIYLNLFNNMSIMNVINKSSLFFSLSECWNGRPSGSMGSPLLHHGWWKMKRQAQGLLTSCYDLCTPNKLLFTCHQCHWIDFLLDFTDSPMQSRQSEQNRCKKWNILKVRERRNFAGKMSEKRKWFLLSTILSHEESGSFVI